MHDVTNKPQLNNTKQGDARIVDNVFPPTRDESSQNLEPSGPVTNSLQYAHSRTICDKIELMYMACNWARPPAIGSAGALGPQSPPPGRWAMEGPPSGAPSSKMNTKP